MTAGFRALRARAARVWIARLWVALLTLVTVFAAAVPGAARADDGVLIVGLTGKYPPFNYIDDRGELVGFDVDFANELCKEIGRRCEFRTLQWDGLLGALLAERIDVVIASMAITEERERAVDFSAPYYESGARLFVAPGAKDPSSPGFRIGVTLGTTYEGLCARAFPNAEVRTLKGDTDVVQDLGAGRLDGMVTDDLVGAYLIRRTGGAVERHGQLLMEERIGIPVKPGRADLLAEINGAIGRMRADGRQRALLAKHLGESESAGAPPAGLVARTLPRLLHATGRTILLCLVGLGLGVAASIALAFALVGNRWLARPVAAWVDFIRATPFLVQLFALYFGPPALGLTIDAWSSGALAIAIHSSAYLAELLKTAYRAVPDGQRLAARSLGLSPIESLRHVVWPQMLPICAAPALGTVVAMIKDSAIVSAIGVTELTLETQQLVASTYKPIELYAMAAVLYFILTWPLLWAGRRLEKRWRERGLLHG